jgi:hypothetical protein
MQTRIIIACDNKLPNISFEETGFYTDSRYGQYYEKTQQHITDIIAIDNKSIGADCV